MKQTNNKTHSQTFSLSSDLFGYLTLLALSLLAFIPLIGKIGFYWDDWPMLWFEVTQGPKGFADAFTGDRPFLGFLYHLTGILLSANPLSWQILTVVFRWLCSCAFLKMLRLMWRDRPNETLWIASLCAVYSGFKQMPIAYVWGNAFILLFFYLLSYVFMLRAIDAVRNTQSRQAVAWTVAGVISYLACTLCTEYYTGLDLARILVIWVALRREESYRKTSLIAHAKTAVGYWLPYLGAFIGFMIWRVFVFQFPSYQPVLMTQLSANPLGTVFGLIRTAIRDSYVATWAAWTEFFRFPISEKATLADRAFWLTFLAAFIIALGAFIGETKRSAVTDADSASDRRWTFEAFLLGLGAVILPGLPYVVTDLSPALTFPRDRWLTAYMFGSCILLVMLIRWLIRHHSQRLVIVTVFIAFMVAGNLLNTNAYVRDWQSQRSFINQLHTRIPDLETPTYFFTDFNPLSFETDNSLTGMVNLGLFPEHDSLQLPVAVGFYDVRFERDITPFANGAPIYQGFRSAIYAGSSENTLVYFYSPPGCLRILDPVQHSDLPIFPSSFEEIMPYSNPNRIIAATEPREQFVQNVVFREPIEEDWCYHFQLADFARQTENWQEIATIGDTALAAFKPGEASELIPFIESYAKTDQWSKNIPLIETIHAMNPDLDAPLCSRLQRLLVENPIYEFDVFDEIQTKFFQIGCKLYPSES